MSGLINQVGARSGIIGQTEIEYEEGTCSMDYAGSSGSGTHGARTGYYTKIGNVVTVQLNLYSSSVSGTWAGTLRVTGFPFTCKQYATFAIRSGGFAQTDNMPSMGFLHTNQTYADMTKFNSNDPRNGRTTGCGAVDLSTYDEIYFICTYLATT